jgi:hypothetical protein
MLRALKLLLLFGAGMLLAKNKGGDGPDGPDGDGSDIDPFTGRPKDSEERQERLNFQGKNASTEMAEVHDTAKAEAEQGRAGDGDSDVSDSSQTQNPVEGPAANHTLLPPNMKRHDIDRITPKSHAQKVNSVVDPDVDMAADIAAIQRGEGTWNPATNEYEINGRTYKVEDTGVDGLRTYPTGGEGVHNLTQLEYRLLQSMIKNNGDLEAAWQQNYRNPNVTDERWNAALEAFRNHKSYQGE